MQQKINEYLKTSLLYSSQMRPSGLFRFRINFWNYESYIFGRTFWMRVWTISRHQNTEYSTREENTSTHPHLERVSNWRYQSVEQSHIIRALHRGATVIFKEPNFLFRYFSRDFSKLFNAKPLQGTYWTLFFSFISQLASLNESNKQQVWR